MGVYLKANARFIFVFLLVLGGGLGLKVMARDLATVGRAPGL